MAKPLHACVAMACAYEVAAITVGRVPTISALCRQRRWLAPVIVGGLAVHLALPGPTPVLPPTF